MPPVPPWFLCLCSHEPMYLSLWPLLFLRKYFPCLPLLDSLLSFVLQVCVLSSFSKLCCQSRLLVFLSSIPPSNLHLGFTNLLTKASKLSIHTSLFFLYKPVSLQNASHVTPTAIFFHPILYSL